MPDWRDQAHPLDIRALTIKDLIQIHLSIVDDLEEREGKPLNYWHTQGGISVSIAKRQDQTSHVLTQLRDEGIVREDKGQIKGISRKRKLYFLTDEGRSQARPLHRGFSKAHVVYLEGGMELADPAEMVASKGGMDLDLIPLLGFTQMHEVVDLRAMANYAHGLNRSFERNLFHGMVTMLGDAPQIPFFVGREGESSRIRKWLDGDHPRAITIYGMPGIGKTTLASKIVRDLDGICNLFWHRIHPWDTAKNFFDSLSQFTSEIGGGQCKNLLDSGRPLTSETIAEALRKDLADSNSVIVFDDFQRIDPKALGFFSTFMEVLNGSDGAKLMVVGRQVMPFYDPAEVRTGAVIRLQLEGLDIESSRKLMRATVLDDEEFKELYRITKGHPLFLEILDSAGAMGHHPDIKRYLYEEVFLKLDKVQRDILWNISVFRYPVRAGALFSGGDVDYTSLENLANRAMIQKIEEDNYDIHDVLRDFFYSTLSQTVRQSCHLAAARYYMDNPGDLEFIEAVYHHSKAGDGEGAAKLLIDRGLKLIGSGFADRVLDLIDNINIKQLDENLWSEMYLLKGAGQMYMGDWDKALGNFYQVLILGEKTDNRFAVAEALRRIGEIRARRGEVQLARENYEEALSISEKLGDLAGMAEAKRSLGQSYQDSGQSIRAIDLYTEARELAERAGEEALVGRANIDLGTLYVNTGQYKKAKEFLMRGEMTFDRLNARYEKAPALLMLGTVAVQEGKLQDALEYYDECIEISEYTGDIRMNGYALAYSGEVHAKIGRYDEAEAKLDDAERIFRRIGEKAMIARVLSTRAKIVLAAGDSKKAMVYATEAKETLSELAKGAEHPINKLIEEIKKKYVGR